MEKYEKNILKQKGIKLKDMFPWDMFLYMSQGICEGLVVTF